MRMHLVRIAVLASIAMLGACGHEVDLKPANGHALPVKPEVARTTPTFRQLIQPPPQARPARVDELETRSKPRPADPFDLPPPTGGAAPALPDPGVPQAPATNSSPTDPGN